MFALLILVDLVNYLCLNLLLTMDNAIFSTVITGTRVRFVDGTSLANGRLEVHYKGQWGTMCSDTFSTTEADVVCRMLGFEDRFVYFEIISSYGCVEKQRQKKYFGIISSYKFLNNEENVFFTLNHCQWKET